MSAIIYLNGEFLPLHSAHISVMDRGFLFGDGVYEVIPVFHQKMFKSQEHLQRLRRSLAAVEIPFTVDDDALNAIFTELFNRNIDTADTKAIYIQITRGAEEKRSHTFPEKASPTVFIQCFTVKTKTTAEMRQGASAITIEDIRWHWCYIKTINLLPNVLFAERAKKAGASEAILIRDGLAREGTSSNLFIVQNQVIITPPADDEILCGVTRNWILDLANTHQLPCVETPISKKMLMQADEVWMTGSIKEILPITRVDEHTIGNGQVGPLCDKMITLYEKSK
jgi:D-alanine transaminase